MALTKMFGMLHKMISAQPARRRQRPSNSVRLVLEVLEARTVPATLFVNSAGTGGAFTTIGAAVTAANPGDTIEVAAGIYQEHVVINKSLTLDGAEAGTLAYMRMGAESVVDATSSGNAFQVAANNVTIDGFTVMNGGNGSFGGIVTPATFSNVNLLNNIINNNTIGIYVNGTNVLVRGNLIEDNNVTGPANGSGIYSDQGSANVTISDNEFRDNMNGGITFAQLPAAVSGNINSPFRNRNLLVTNNDFNDINLGGFADVTGGVISFNTVKATAQFSNIGVAGGVVGLVISSNSLSGGTSAVRIVTAFTPVANSGVVISVANQFTGQSVAGVNLDTGAESGTIDASRNFWNGPTGPTNAGNPAGTGEALIAPDNNVTFAPFNVTSHYVVNRAGIFLGLTAQESFVQALYVDALGRAGDRPELDNWVAQLNGPGGSDAAIASVIEHSPEARDKLVNSWYQNYLGRQAVGGEEMGWVNLLLQGNTEEQVLSQFLASPEFYNRAQTLSASGTPDERYVKALFQVLLGRAGSAAEVSSWVNQLPTLGRQGVAFAFLTGSEYRTVTFEQYYNVLLNRAADSAGLQGFVSSSLDQTSVRVAIEGSAEYFNKSR
jgi:hypothetical protein